MLVVANKVDGEREEADVAALYALGLGEPVPVSALHGRGAGDLLDRVVALLPEDRRTTGPTRRRRSSRGSRWSAAPTSASRRSSTRLVGEERSVVYREAGTTRDSVDAVLEWPDGPVRFVDTAGMRRQTRVSGVEYYSFVRATRAIERADVAVVVIEAPEGFTSEDKKIVVRVLEAGRGLLIAANKWDLVEEKDRTFKRSVRGGCALRERDHHAHLGHAGPGGAPTASAPDGSPRALGAPGLDGEGQRGPPTGAARSARRRGTPATSTTRRRSASGPPTFVIFGGSREPDPSYQRYLENRLRRTFGYDGVPIRLTFRPRTRGPQARRRKRH